MAILGMSNTSKALLDSLNAAERVRMNSLNTKEQTLNRQQSALNTLKSEVKDVANVQASFTSAQDADQLKTALKDFIKQYNESNTALRNATGKGASFQNESSVRSALSRLDSSVRSVNGGNLRDLGIEIARDGSLSLNETKFSEKATADFAGAKAIAMGGAGRVSDVASSLNQTGQGLMAFEDRISRQVARIAVDKEREQARIDRADLRNRMQVAAFEQLRASMESAGMSTGNFINTSA